MDGRRGSGHFAEHEQRLVLIGIQARTASTRLPDKANLKIGDKTVLSHVVNSCLSAADYLNRTFIRTKNPHNVKTLVLTPGNDPLVRKYSGIIPIQDFPQFEEWDVLSRYVHAAKQDRAVYIVRITADCIFTMPYLVSRHIKTAIFESQDYVTNCHYRTFREGMDVEVLSMQALLWLDQNSKTKEEREHVTIKLRDRNQVPGHFRFWHIMNEGVDDSHIKTSIDTKEDYDRAVAEYDSIRSKRAQAMKRGDRVG